jgi:hypothetical protein
VERQVQRKYWDVEKQTEIWTKLGPTSGDGFFLVFSVCFSGRTLPRHAATAVRLRAQTANGNPPRIGQRPTLTVEIDGDEAVDLLRLASYTAHVPCPECNLDAVLVDLPDPVFSRMLAARTVRGESMGFRFHLDQAHIEALQRFAGAIGFRSLPEGRQ